MTLYSRSFIFALAVGLTFVIQGLLNFTPLGVLENIYKDLLLVSESVDATRADEIIVVEINDATLDKFAYRSPIDREFLSVLVSKLADAKVKAIGIDIVFDRPSDAAKDHKLRETLLANRDIVFVPELEPELTRDHDFQKAYLDGIKRSNISFAKDPKDGIVRHFPTVETGNGSVLEPMGFAVAGKAVGHTNENYQRIAYLPLTDGSNMPFKVYPAEAVILLPDAWLADKYVLIGTNLPNIDQFRTPYISLLGETSGILPGVHIHAHILEQALSKRRLGDTPTYIGIILSFIAAIIGAKLALLRTDVLVRISAVLGASLLLLALGYMIFAFQYLITPVFSIAITLFTASATMSVLVWQRDRNEKRFVKTAWSRYVNANVVDFLVANPDNLKLGGTGAEASFIFTDIAGFTKLSETLKPSELAQVINEYLDLMTEEFRKSGATLDKIVGDAVVGFFGAPIPDKNHADKAVSLAINLNRVGEEFRKTLAEKNIALGKTRIGINSGYAIVGNFGGSEFFDFTAFGDTVNTAARLEGANKLFGGNICVSRQTMESAKTHSFRKIGTVYVKGKDKAVEVWEPFSSPEAVLCPPNEYAQAYDLIVAQPKGAVKRFRDLERSYPNDHLVRFQIQRLEAGIAEDPIEIHK